MSDPTCQHVKKVVHRKRWFLVGLVVGILVFPWAAGLQYRDSWERIQGRAQNLGEVASEQAQIAWSRVSAGVEELVQYLRGPGYQPAEGRKGFDDR